MDFEQVNEAIAPFPELESPAFIQGMLIGLLCGDNDIQEAVWVKKLIEEAQIKSVKESFLKVLDEVFQETNKGMNGSGFELNLCIPDDSESLVFRAAMLGQLCEGILYGLGLIGALNDAEREIPREVQELVEDLGQIARIDIGDLSDSESLTDVEESDFMELVEFVRVGILTINEELNPTQAPPIMDASPETDTLH
ncbi:hypothetical protein THMIRHAM_14240 [Thiomicrorhabdus immobilis]|uniref:YecA family protein n=1 Tax=Thiomicrorhabdus immobilis TaxID=2791037 RepID=A0ABN6CYF5_9GAMM|nr:UPF0149 family protein [Thiomicrorhabdus immobilis]BCN93639.1 hypothetical protein THMIRHAM_14240 [Thiomicrorhabdus immobilis]